VIRPDRIGRSLAAVIAASLIVVVGAGPVRAAQPDDAGHPGRNRLTRYIEDLDSLRARFHQVVIDRDLEIVEETRGEVVLKKPGRFRWHYTEPFERVIVSDGDRVWLYEADLQQVTVRRLDAGLGETPAALLSGDAQVLDKYEFLGTLEDSGIEWIQLKPGSTDSDFERIGLGFVGDDLVEIDLEDRLGQRTRLSLSEIERSVYLADEEFNFNVPEGVDIIGETDL
jgi:outer membrane lipoprotein carrier protein